MTDSVPVIECRGVGLYFHRFHRRDRITSWIRLGLMGGGGRKERFWALDDVSFSLQSGETLGIVGHNGAGKSSLLKVLCGVYQPDRGRVAVRGRISPVLSTGAGFSPDLSGRDNFYLAGIFMGLDRGQLDLIYDEAVLFAGLEESMDTPVKYYSSGMKERLSFTVSAYAKPDVLLLDEMLETGDKDFRIQANQRIREMAAEARATIMVSHNMDSLCEHCTLVLWLDSGRVRALGPTTEVLDAYVAS